MEEIKFKAWNKAEKRMGTVLSISFLGENRIGAVVGYDNGGISFETEDTVILLPYTGMHDSEENEIYKGDIVQVPDDWDTFGMVAGEVYEVYFAYGGFRLKPKHGKNAKGYWIEDDRVLIKLGNIYENPELLEQLKSV